MQIHTNLATGGLNRVAGAEVKAKAVGNDQPQVSFSESESLERSLKGVPDVRADHVARAQALVEDPAYPPRETIRRISNLLAMEINGKSEI